MLKFISCDWGTTSFRLKLVDASDLSVLAEMSKEMGVAKVNRMFLDGGLTDGVSRLEYFKAVLADGLRELQGLAKEELAGLLIICSGMASSSIGLKELPFALLPFNTSGKNLFMDFMGVTDDFPNSLILLSGLKNERDVMRGEETQLIGIIQDYKAFSGDGLFVLPGTHSKHIWVKNSQIVDFTTFLTGELFEVLGRHSILGASISPNEDTENPDHVRAFTSGVQDGFNRPLLSRLFKVRTQDLFGVYTPSQNFHYLSGVLIGSELKSLETEADIPIYLCSTSNVFNPYRMAFEILGIPSIIISKEMVEKSVVSGQFKVFNQNMNHERSIFLGSF
ncbi:2-dehydro-3-deoxygalactonokinase [Lunatimonas lonarensis]|nr:2-dehydro-3-deoxygalactonokinase [Lunatimonas lonarensis]